MIERTKPTRLGPTEIEAVLTELGDEWRMVESTLERHWTFQNFEETMAFVNQVFELAQTLDHHPDIHIEYLEVTLNLWTHITGGITDRDVALATRLNEL